MIETHPNGLELRLDAPQQPSSFLPEITHGVDMGRLVGYPHLFARMKRLRDGYLIEPIGLMTLRPDGKIGGYAHHNEGSWIPYAHSPISSERAFAFVTAHNNWIPSSTWTQSMGRVPIGFFCDEPESTDAAQQLCLVPHVPLSKEITICYLVASCVHFYQRTVPILLKELFAEGIQPHQVKVVVNGCDRNLNEEKDGVAYAFTTHNAWEWSALYEAPLRWQFGYTFLIHDTSVIYPGFRRSVEEVNGHLYWDHLPASPMARCLLGLYSHDFLMRCNEWLKSIDHIDKKNGVIAEAAGELLLRAKSALVIGDLERNGAARAAEWKEMVDFFNTGSPRVRRVFSAIKLHKFIHAGPANPDKL